MTFHLFYSIQGVMDMRPQVEEERMFFSSETAEKTLKMILTKMRGKNYGYELRMDATTRHGGGSWYISRGSVDIMQDTFTAVFSPKWNDRWEEKHYSRGGLLKVLLPFIRADFE